MRPMRMLPTFNFDCVYRPTFLRIYLRQLVQLGVPVTDAQINGSYKRWSGDMVELGRGEILVLDTMD
jgi:formylmethanofuran dehydrogenase subunit C